MLRIVRALYHAKSSSIIFLTDLKDKFGQARSLTMFVTSLEDCQMVVAELGLDIPVEVLR